MSFLVEEEMECPLCQYPNKVEVWSVVNVKEDPELKDILLGGELNMAECVSCKQVFYAEHFIIYHDPDHQLMAFVYPFSDRDAADKWREKTAVDFAVFQQDAKAAEKEALTYAPLTLFGLDELVQVAQKEEEMTIQMEILRALAEEHRLKTKALGFAQARELGVPALLPLVEEETGGLRERVLRGLERLLQINNHLFVYRDLLNEMSNGRHDRFDF